MRPDQIRRHPASLGSVALAAALALAVGAPAPVSAEASLRLEAEPSSPGSGHQQVTEPTFALSLINQAGGNGDTTAYGVQVLVSTPDPGLLTEVAIEIVGSPIITILPGDLEDGTPVYTCSGRSVPPHDVYPAFFTAVEVGDIVSDASVEMTVTVAGSDGLSVHFEAIGEGLRQQGNATVCRDVFAPPGHHVTAQLGGGSTPVGQCEAELDKTSDVDAVLLDEQMVFTLTAVNTGDCELTSVVLTDAIPIVVDDGGNEFPAFEVVGVDPAPASATDNEIVWDLGTLAVGDPPFVATLTALFNEPEADGHQVVNAACLTAAELDEPECDNAVVAVGEVTQAEPIGGPGFWCRQTRAALVGHHSAQFTLAELEGWLADINSTSMVFTELYDTSLLDYARTLLCRPDALRTAADRLARHHLTLWFNLVSERVGADVALGDLCPGSELAPDGTEPAWTVGYVRDEAESELMSGDDDEMLRFWMAVEDFINNASAPEDCALSFRRPRGSRRLVP